MNNLLTVKNLALSYEGKKIIENVSFEVTKGDFLVIIGENGSGKSTLIKALLSLKDIDAGEISFSKSSPSCRIGYLPQMHPIRDDFPASAWEVVLSGNLNKMGLLPFFTKKEKENAKKNMELLSVYDLKDECFCNLSGGQKQRILLARALCAAEELLILDEPVASLDSQAVKAFYSSIRKINDSGIAVIMVSHDIAQSLSVSKHILKLGNGTVEFYGDTAKYLQGE
ncbi:MAG: metal ABC transporter ATP-binding protein [Clostridia bacterium]|nr:metal ABC transporter ATP-binding protein [Clostridia bacterium]